MAGETPYSTVFSRWRERLERQEHDEEIHDAEEEVGAVRDVPPVGALAALRRVPFSVWTLIGLLSGFLVGFWVPGMSFLGEGVKAAFGFISLAAPLIIFFTITPALVTMYKTSSAGKFALYVVLGFSASTLLGGLFALLITILFFPEVALGTGAGGISGAMQRAFNETGLDLLISPPFRAIWAALILSAVFYFGANLKGEAPRNPVGRALRTISDIYELIGVHGVAALGRFIKLIMPFALFAIGVFIVVSAPVGAVEGYFVSVGILIVVTVLWLVLVAFALSQYTKFPISRIFRDYVAVVYPFAWATSSSSASIPINMEAARKGLGVRPQVRSFVLPLGATVNLDGTMMAAIVATVVAGNVTGYDVSLVTLLIALVPLLLITIGTPGIPGGLAAVSASIISTLLGVPAESASLFEGVYVALLLGLNDMFRTAVNTLDNGFLALLLDKWWPERFAPGAEPNPFMEPPEGHLETQGRTVGSPLAVDEPDPPAS